MPGAWVSTFCTMALSWHILRIASQEAFLLPFCAMKLRLRVSSELQPGGDFYPCLVESQRNYGSWLCYDLFQNWKDFPPWLWTMVVYFISPPRRDRERKYQLSSVMQETTLMYCSEYFPLSHLCICTLRNSQAGFTHSVFRYQCRPACCF